MESWVQAATKARGLISNHVHKTPLLTSSYIDSLTLATSVSFKCELFQKGGSFKVRGATHAALLAPKGATLITHSSGNHGQAVAIAAKSLGMPCVVVMPDTAPQVKLDAVRDTYGARVVLTKPHLRNETTQSLVAEDSSLYFIHPSDDMNVIYGQASCGLEILDQTAEPFDYVFCPVGGGGLLSGTIIAMNSVADETNRPKVIAVEPSVVDDAYRSISKGELQKNEVGIRSVADGLNTTLGPNTYKVISSQLTADSFCLVTEQEILDAQRLIMERMKIVVEPSGAVALAGLLKSGQLVEGKRVCVICCGGNADLSKLFQ